MSQNNSTLNLAEIQLLRGLLWSHIEQAKREGNCAKEWMTFMEKTLKKLDDLEDEIDQL